MALYARMKVNEMVHILAVSESEKGLQPKETRWKILMRNERNEEKEESNR